MNRRRQLLLAVGIMPLTLALVGLAQPVNGVRRIGYLSGNRQGNEADLLSWSITRHALLRAGWEEGRNLRIERRYAEGDSSRLNDLARELVALNVELIYAGLSAATLAAQRATATIPIVMVGVISPVELGMVQSLAHPGGNVTGTTAPGVETAAKSIQILRDVAPSLTRLAILFNPTSPVAQSFNAARMRAASALGMIVHTYPVTRSDEVPGALKAIDADSAQMLLVNWDGVFQTRLREITNFALEHRILSIGVATYFTKFGGALYYGSNLEELIERSVSFVDRILRGAKPADLPVEEPTNFDLVVNLKTMQAIGVTVPRGILLRATEVIE